MSNNFNNLVTYELPGGELKYLLDPVARGVMNLRVDYFNAAQSESLIGFPLERSVVTLYGYGQTTDGEDSRFFDKRQVITGEGPLSQIDTKGIRFNDFAPQIASSIFYDNLRIGEVRAGASGLSVNRLMHFQSRQHEIGATMIPLVPPNLYDFFRENTDPDTGELNRMGMEHFMGLSRTVLTDLPHGIAMGLIKNWRGDIFINFPHAKRPGAKDYSISIRSKVLELDEYRPLGWDETLLLNQEPLKLKLISQDSHPVWLTLAGRSLKEQSLRLSVGTFIAA